MRWIQPTRPLCQRYPVASFWVAWLTMMSTRGPWSDPQSAHGGRRHRPRRCTSTRLSSSARKSGCHGLQPRDSLADRGGAQVQKARGGRSKQDDLVHEQSGWQAPRGHIDGSEAPERAPWRTTCPSERDPSGSPIVDVDREPPSVLLQADAFEAWVPIDRVRRSRGPEFNVWKTEQATKKPTRSATLRSPPYWHRIRSRSSSRNSSPSSKKPMA